MTIADFLKRAYHAQCIITHSGRMTFVSNSKYTIKIVGEKMWYREPGRADENFHSVPIPIGTASRLLQLPRKD